MDDRDTLDIINALDKYYQKKEANQCPFCGCDTTNMKFKDKLRKLLIKYLDYVKNVRIKLSELI